MLLPDRTEIETLSSTDLARLLTMVEDVISERLNAPETPNPREGYFTQGPGREVLQRDAEAVREFAPAMIPDTQEPAGVKLYRTLEVLEYMSATLLVIGGAMYRVGCMGGDVEDRRPLMLLRITVARAPRWSDPGRVPGPATGVNLEVGGRVTINGTVYGVRDRTEWGMRLEAVR